MNSLSPRFIDVLVDEFDSLIVKSLIHNIKLQCINESILLVEQDIEIDESSWFGSIDVDYIENSREEFIRELFILSHSEELFMGTLASKFPSAAFQYFYKKHFDEYDNGFDRINASVDLLKALLGMVRGSEDDYLLILHLSEVISDVLVRKKNDIEGMYRFLGFESFRSVSIYISDAIISYSKRKFSHDINEIYWDIYKIVLVDYISAMFEDD